MIKLYRTTAGTLHDRPLSDQALLNIARIVRACAEIEDLVTLRICKLVDLDEPTTTALLGRAPFKRRLATLEYFESTYGKRALGRHRKRFDSAFDHVMEVRNAVAHSAFIGVDENGHYCFLTDATGPPEAGSAFKRVITASEDSLAAFALDAEKMAVSLCWRLRLRPWRDIRFQQPLLPHRRKAPQVGKRQRQRGSSQA